ncbi:MAG: FecR domain-containing protein [Pseudomonadota bacterium]
MSEWDKIRAEAHHWRARRDNGDLDAESRRAFDCWMAADPRHGAAFAEAELVWTSLEDLPLDQSLDRPLLRERVLAWLRSLKRPVHQHEASYSGGRLAASFAGLAGLCLLVFASLAVLGPDETRLPNGQTSVVHRTGLGEIRTVDLPDGSRVTLGAQTEISVSLGPERRTVTMSRGSLFADVAKDEARPFIARAGGTSVSVTGTAFDIQYKDDITRIAVAEGSVKVHHPRTFGGLIDRFDGPGHRFRAWPLTRSVSLQAGERLAATRDGGLGTLATEDVAAIGAWRAGQLVYLRASVAEVLADARRYTPEPLLLGPGVGALELSATFDADDIDGLLETLDIALPIRIERAEGARRLMLEE